MFAAPPPDYFLEAHSSDEEEVTSCQKFHELAEALSHMYDDQEAFQKDAYKFYHMHEQHQIEAALTHDIFSHTRPKPWREEKNLAKADTLRLEANECYRSNKLRKALRLFNESLMYVPTSESFKYSKTTEHEEEAKNALANVYFNRGLTLFRLERFQDCLLDLERAFSFGHAKFQAKESMMVLFKCYLRTCRFSEAEALMDELLDIRVGNKYYAMLRKRMEAEKLRIVREGHLSVGVAIAMLTTAKAVDDMCKHIARDQETAANDLINSNSVLKSDEVNGLFPCLSNAVEYEYNPQQGRCFKAARDIQPGEVLVDEPPYCISLMPDQWKLRCLHCCKATENPVACSTCAMVVFCNEKCKEEEASLHTAECPMMGNIMEASKTKIGSLAVRMVLKAGLKTMLGYRHVLEDLTDTESRTGFILTPISGQHYLDICTLLTHKQNWGPQLLFHAAIYVAYHVHLLKMVRFFEPEMVFTESQEHARSKMDDVSSGGFCASPSSNPSTSQFHIYPRSRPKYTTATLLSQQSTSADGYDATTWDRMVYVGRMMFRHLLALRSNRFGIDENAYRIGDTNNEPMLVARAVAVTGMVLNHSCEYKTVYTMVPSTGRIVFKAVVPIKRGEEVTHCYTCNYATAPLEERRKFLYPYFFECQCRACTENWGTVFDALEQQVCSIFVCPRCRKEIDSDDEIPPIKGMEPDTSDSVKWDWSSSSSSSSSSTTSKTATAVDSSTAERDEEEKSSSDATDSTLDDVNEQLERLELAKREQSITSDAVGGAGDSNVACENVPEIKGHQMEDINVKEMEAINPHLIDTVANKPATKRKPFYSDFHDQTPSPEDTTCRHCGYDVSKDIKELKPYWYDYDEAMKVMSSGDSEAARGAVERYIAKLHQVVSPRSLEYITAAENLKKIYMRQGHSRAVDPMGVDWDDSSDEEEKPHPVFSYESPLF